MSKILWSLIALAAVASPVFAESATQEFAGKWFLNPQTQNWTCATEPGLPAIGGGTGAGQCKAGNLANLSFVRAFPTVQTRATGTKYFFYVQDWGVEGPGSECFSDSIVLFELPYSIAGAKADVAPIYRGVITPPSECPGNSPTRAFWNIHSVFRDPALGATYVMAERLQFLNGSREIWKGTSYANAQGYDEGIYFTWTKLIGTTIAGHTLFGAYLIPDAGGMIWRGYLENTNSSGTWGATPVIVNWSNNTIQYKISSTGWATISPGGNITSTTGLPYIQYGGFMNGYTFVRGRYELHFSSQVPKSGNRPLATCPDNIYLPNNNGIILAGRWDNGHQPYYLVVDINFNLVQSSRDLTSTIYPLPSDTFSHGGVLLVSTLAWPTTLYYGSQNWSMCNIVLNNFNHWSGSGIRFGRTQDVP